MRIQSVYIKNYRSLHDVELELTDLTVLLGSNGTGKSSILYALNWFFNGGDLERDDITAGIGDQTISVQVTFAKLDELDCESLAKYGTGETATFTRTWHPDSGGKLTGRARAYSDFESIRGIASASELRKKYNELRQRNLELELPSVRSKEAALTGMNTWEQNHPDQLDEATVSATHMFGFAGTAKLAGRFGFAFVTATEDVAGVTEDSRGTLLAQLIERAADAGDIEDRIAGLKTSFENDLGTLLSDRYDSTLRSVEVAVASSLQQYVGTASVRLAVDTPEVRVPQRRIILRASDGDHHTNVGRQGQGFQRALLIAVLQELSGVSDARKSSSILLAIEEPELYQHPTQARHFASVLKTLAENREQRIQVIFATHSPYFVDAGTFEYINRISKEHSAHGVRTTRSQHASGQSVGECLRTAGLDPQTDIEKARASLRRNLNEVLFARAVLLVEGPSDVAVMRGVAARSRSLDAIGVACASTGGKTGMPVALAVLQSLKIPVFIVFDGDASKSTYLDVDSVSSADQRESGRQAERYNRILLNMSGGDPTEWPSNRVGETYACFEDCLESYLSDQWPVFTDFVAEERERSGVKTPKPPSIYEMAAQVLDNPPEHLLEIIKRVTAMATLDN